MNAEIIPGPSSEQEGRRTGGVYSVRMRASLEGRHVSGAERLVTGQLVETVARELRQRAKARTPAPNYVRVRIDPVPEDEIERAPCLSVTTIGAATVSDARVRAEALLAGAGVSETASAAAFCGLERGWASEPVAEAAPIRGAVLLDRTTGRRLDALGDRGVRASRFDYAPGWREPVLASLADAGLGHFRTHEALALATKVLWAGVAAELCWSDDDGYVAGYVSTPSDGYVRFDRFKPAGAVGGRAFFVDPGIDVAGLIGRLEQAPLWIEGVPEIRLLG